MKNILLLGLLAVFLSSCSESVQEIQVTTIEVSKTPLNLPNPDPLQLQDVEWIIITKDNAMEVFDYSWHLHVWHGYVLFCKC